MVFRCFFRLFCLFANREICAADLVRVSVSCVWNLFGTTYCRESRQFDRNVMLLAAISWHEWMYVAISLLTTTTTTKHFDRELKRIFMSIENASHPVLFHTNTQIEQLHNALNSNQHVTNWFWICGCSNLQPVYSPFLQCCCCCCFFLFQTQFSLSLRLLFIELCMFYWLFVVLNCV